MRKLQLIVVGCFALFFAGVMSFSNFSRTAQAQNQTEGQLSATAAEAPTGFDTLTNGFTPQAMHDANREVYAEQEFISDGLGPVYNAQSCGECHQNPVTGAGSQITELRAGRYDLFMGFLEVPGGSLINDRAIHPSIQERIPSGHEVRTFRITTSTLGAGYVECIADSTLQSLAAGQPAQSGGRIRGQVIMVPVLEANNALRVGRFGWKNQHASLKSFAADAYLNEMGITSPLQPTENTSLGNSVAAYDMVADPEDDGDDLDVFANFMRATKAPSRDTLAAATASARNGAQLFTSLGCAVCHVPNITTAMPGTAINGGTFTVPAALGNKIIHPYSDFLLHDIDTGDGIVQNGGPATRNKIRTAPLWGLRTRDRLMHDGLTLTAHDAIMQHGGEAVFVGFSYRLLSTAQKRNVIDFLNSL